LGSKSSWGEFIVLNGVLDRKDSREHPGGGNIIRRACPLKDSRKEGGITNLWYSVKSPSRQGEGQGGVWYFWEGTTGKRGKRQIPSLYPRVTWGEPGKESPEVMSFNKTEKRKASARKTKHEKNMSWKREIEKKRIIERETRKVNNTSR